jgi:hypothetical protein
VITGGNAETGVTIDDFDITASYRDIGKQRNGQPCSDSGATDR